MSMLSEILATKRTEVDCRRSRLPLTELQERLVDVEPTRDFQSRLVRGDRPALIAEVKKASPSKGVIREDFDPIAIAREYGANGADCLSVLTDEPYFQGSISYIGQIREVVAQPLLRKDFIIDAWQIPESRLAGADAILLIVAALQPSELTCFLSLAREYDLAVLVEVHDAGEMGEALQAGANLIGINNRDLHTFRTSIDVTTSLLREFAPLPDGVLIVSESGIFTADDVDTLWNAGANAVLVGEALMRKADVGAGVRELLKSA